MHLSAHPRQSRLSDKTRETFYHGDSEKKGAKRLDLYDKGKRAQSNTD